MEGEEEDGVILGDMEGEESMVMCRGGGENEEEAARNRRGYGCDVEEEEDGSLQQ